MTTLNWSTGRTLLDKFYEEYDRVYERLSRETDEARAIVLKCELEKIDEKIEKEIARQGL